MLRAVTIHRATMSVELDVMLAPARAYAQAMEAPADLSPAAALRRPALVALIIGVVAAMTAADHVDLRLVASTTLYWSFVPAIQLLAAFALVRASPRLTISTADAIDVFFAGHGPWSLYLLAVAGWTVAAPLAAHSMTPVFAAALIPAVWTPFIVSAFCREVLGDSRRAARRKTTMHQALMWIVILTYYGLAAQVWPRLIGLLQQLGWLHR
jgi:hypothetical protein